MQFRKALLSFLSISFLLVIAWIFLLFNQSILEENSNENLHHVPSNATFAMRLDGRELAEKTLFSIFLESKDAEVLALLQELFQKNSKKEGQFKNYGIDYLSDIVVFEVPFKNTNLQGLLVNISNKLLFHKNMKGNKSVFACNNEVGVILFSSQSSKNLLESDVQILANKIIATTHDHSMANFIGHRESGKFIETYNKGSFFGESSCFGESKILFELQKSSLLLSGSLALNPNNKEESKTLTNILSPKGLHFSSSVIPKALSDTLNLWLNQFSIKTPEITQLSLNLFGTKVINHSSGFFVVPKMELFVQFKENISIQEILNTPDLISYFDYTLTNESISFQNEKLYFKQLTPTSFYIGINKNPLFKVVKDNDFVLINGNLQALTTIEGGGMMTAILSMMPIYRASKNISMHTESLSVRLTKKNNKEVKLAGDLKFSKGIYPMNELIKFLLVGQVID